MHGLLGQLKNARPPSGVVKNVQPASEDTEELFPSTSDVIDDGMQNTSALSDVFETTRTGKIFNL